MTATYTAKKISPMLAVADMDETLAFYQEVLGFTSMMKSLEYSIVERDGQTIHFMESRGRTRDGMRERAYGDLC